MNQLKQYIAEHAKNFAELTSATERRALADALFQMIADTYEYLSIDRRGLCISPYLNKHCGISISERIRVTLDSDYAFKGDYSKRSDTTAICAAAISMFKTPGVTAIYIKDGSCGDRIGVSILIPPNWERNQDVLHDIALLCGRIFRKFK